MLSRAQGYCAARRIRSKNSAPWTGPIFLPKVPNDPDRTEFPHTFTVTLHLNPTDEGRKFLQNIDIYQQHYTVSHQRKPESEM
jgi:hypothetical protein